MKKNTEGLIKFNEEFALSFDTAVLRISKDKVYEYVYDVESNSDEYIKIIDKNFVFSKYCQQGSFEEVLEEVKQHEDWSIALVDENDNDVDTLHYNDGEQVHEVACTIVPGTAWGHDIVELDKGNASGIVEFFYLNIDDEDGDNKLLPIAIDEVPNVIVEAERK